MNRWPTILRVCLLWLLLTVSATAHRPSAPLLTRKRWHTFSSPDTRDLFSIKLEGSTLIASTAVFTITSARGIVLHRETFSAVSLIGYQLDANEINSRPEQADSIIRQRVQTFFADAQFHQPAIASTDTFDSDLSLINESTWLKLRADQTAIGFSYLVGEEDNRSIAYDKKRRRIVVYFSCC